LIFHQYEAIQELNNKYKFLVSVKIPSWYNSDSIILEHIPRNGMPLGEKKTRIGKLKEIVVFLFLYSLQHIQSDAN